MSFFLKADRGQTPARMKQVASGKDAGFAFNFSNKMANAKAGMASRIYFNRAFRPGVFALTSDVTCSLTLDMLKKPLGSGSYTSFVGAAVPTLSASTESALVSVAGVWPDWLAGQWIESTILTHTSGVPNLVSLTVWGTWI